MKTINCYLSVEGVQQAKTMLATHLIFSVYNSSINSSLLLFRLLHSLDPDTATPEELKEAFCRSPIVDE